MKNVHNSFPSMGKRFGIMVPGKNVGYEGLDTAAADP